MISDDLKNRARYEIKFTTNIAHYEYLDQWIYNNPAGFRTAHPSRTINNIYFDTYDLDSYCENMAGISSRTKLRLRWYGSIEEISNPNFELKIKRNKLGWKKTQNILLQDHLCTCPLSSIKERVHEQLDRDMASRFMQSDYPVLINTYERRYFVSSDGLIRITLDNNLKFYDQRLYRTPNFQFSTHSPDITVLEVKVSAINMASVPGVIASLPLPATKSSKYVIGIQSILGH